LFHQVTDPSVVGLLTARDHPRSCFRLFENRKFTEPS
jgi:hypothetical protein